MTHEFSIPCSTTSLQAIRDFVRKILIANKIDEAVRELIVLAVDEACANVIIHGNECNSDNKLKLELTKEHNELTIKVMDTGCYKPDLKFINQNIVSEKVKNRDSGGLGLFIINKIMDQVEYKSEKNYNFCLLRKSLEKDLYA